jgi:hypothetical protein
MGRDHGRHLGSPAVPQEKQFRTRIFSGRPAQNRFHIRENILMFPHMSAVLPIQPGAPAIGCIHRKTVLSKDHGRFAKPLAVTFDTVEVDYDWLCSLPAPNSAGKLNPISSPKALDLGWL